MTNGIAPELATGGDTLTVNEVRGNQRVIVTKRQTSAELVSAIKDLPTDFLV